MIDAARARAILAKHGEEVSEAEAARILGVLVPLAQSELAAYHSASRPPAPRSRATARQERPPVRPRIDR